MGRKDISENLIHFTKGDTHQAAYTTLIKIINESRLLGGDGLIRGNYKCVCFSEAPISELKYGLLNPNAYSRYSPFGILFNKKWIFERGGRPVIYQADHEFLQLPESHKWRHVRYEPHTETPIDFTWEREWRIKIDELPFNPSVAQIIVPDEEWAMSLIYHLFQEKEHKILSYSELLDEEELFMIEKEPFDWIIYTLWENNIYYRHADSYKTRSALQREFAGDFDDSDG